MAGTTGVVGAVVAAVPQASTNTSNNVGSYGILKFSMGIFPA